MSQSEKVTRRFGKIFLKDTVLSTNTSGNLTVNDVEVGEGGGTGTAGSFETLFVNSDATLGSLSIGTVEGISATLNDLGHVSANNISFQNLIPNNVQLITQGTAIFTPVSAITQFGTIRTVTATLATQGSAQIAVNHPLVNSDSRVFTSISKYTGIGIPHVHVADVQSSQFSMILSNASTVDQLNASVDISYMILNLD